MGRVILAMSGGVDSSVAAHLLLQQGHDVIGVFMRHGEESAAACAVEGQPSPLLPILESRTDHKQGCCSAQDADDARRVADRLRIPFYALNLQGEFRRITDYFVQEYTGGRTPNPCIVCNNELKFGRLFAFADSVGADFVATGHYARLLPVNDSGGIGLFRGVDAGKDQSYVLFGVDRRRLHRMLLPIGEYNKPAIRQLASELGLRVAEKRDSQEICFVPPGKHAEFVRQRSGNRCMAGEIVTTSGHVVGRHAGIEQFTIGQRKGLGIAMGEPHFVVRIEPETRRVVIGPKAALARCGLTAAACNWLSDPPDRPFRCQAKIRYNCEAAEAIGELLPENRLSLKFSAPRYGVAPGQAVVCYDGPRLLGGGWIEG